jgi:hypothetical protein
MCRRRIMRFNIRRNFARGAYVPVRQDASSAVYRPLLDARRRDGVGYERQVDGGACTVMPTQRLSALSPPDRQGRSNRTDNGRPAGHP